MSEKYRIFFRLFFVAKSNKAKTQKNTMFINEFYH